MRTLALMAVFGFSACTTAAAVIPDGQLNTGDPDLDPDDDPNVDPDPDPDPTSEFEGEWTAGMALIGDLGRGPQELCVVELIVEVDDQGDFAATGDCPLQFGGGGGRASYAVTLDGEMTDDGQIKAGVQWERSAQWMGELGDTALDGEVDVSSGFAAGEVLIDLGWTETDGTVEVEFKR